MGNFKIFGLPHFIYILVAVVVSVLLIFALRKAEDRLRKIAGVSLVSISGFFVFLEFLGRVLNGADIGENLPFNPFHIFVFVLIFVEVTKNITWVKFGYFIILPISVISLFIVPNYYCAYNTISLAMISYFLIQALLIAYSVLSLIWNDIYLSKKDIVNVSCNFLVIICAVHIVNVFFRFTTIGIHADYFGTMAENYDVLISFVSSLIPIPFVNILPVVALVVGIEYLLILPFDILKSMKDRQDQYEELVALGNLKAQQSKRKKSKSHILVRSEVKATPKTPKGVNNYTNKSGFVSVTKEVQVHKDDSK